MVLVTVSLRLQCGSESEHRCMATVCDSPREGWCGGGAGVGERGAPGRVINSWKWIFQSMQIILTMQIQILCGLQIVSKCRTDCAAIRKRDPTTDPVSVPVLSKHTTSMSAAIFNTSGNIRCMPCFLSLKVTAKPHSSMTAGIAGGAARTNRSRNL